MNNWMMKCEEVSKLVSQSLDQTLPFHQRIGIRLHMMMCNLCSQNFRQIIGLQKTVRLFMNENEKIEPPETLSPAKKEEMKKVIDKISDES